MKIAGLQKLTLLDYPERTAATVFTMGCNFRCPFCHNAELVVGLNDEPIPKQGLLDFLATRQGLLDGVCITGGEPLLHAGLESLCGDIKGLGFDIKLDTNGSFPDRLRSLIDQGLIDFVALDVKNSPVRYAQTIGLDSLDTDAISESIDLLISNPCEYEMRTTMVREFHDAASLIELAHWIAGAKVWYLQNFKDAENVLAGKDTLHPFPEAELRSALPHLQEIIENTQLRGL